jgi:hypothetical protein
VPVRIIGSIWQAILRFISLDESDIRQLARKFKAKVQSQGANEKAYRKLFPKLTAGGQFLSRDRLHEVLHEAFGTNLNEREVEQLLRYMDVDSDGEVSQDDFVTFLKHAGDHLDERGNMHASTIVDVAVSSSAQQEAALAAMGFQMAEVRGRSSCPAINTYQLTYIIPFHREI